MNRFGTVLVCGIGMGLLVLAAACSPSGGGSEAPAFLEVTPGALDFQAQEETQFLEVANTGGGTLSFQVKVSA